MTRRLASFACAALMASTLTACATPTRQQIGVGAGAMVGGVAGGMATGGSTLGTLGGAALGGVIGRQIAKYGSVRKKRQRQP